MELFGIRRQRGRDLETGIVLGASLGIAALFLFWATTMNSTTGGPQSILFGSIFLISPDTLPVITALSALALAIVAVLYRPLLISTVSVELATAGGVAVKRTGFLYLLAMGAAVSLSCLTIGAILSTALLIGPGASALRLAKSPRGALLCAALIGLAATWLGILLAYDSYTWPPSGHGWPVSFFVTALIFAFYLLSALPRSLANMTAPKR